MLSALASCLSATARSRLRYWSLSLQWSLSATSRSPNPFTVPLPIAVGAAFVHAHGGIPAGACAACLCLVHRVVEGHLPVGLHRMMHRVPVGRCVPLSGMAMRWPSSIPCRYTQALPFQTFAVQEPLSATIRLATSESPPFHCFRICRCRNGSSSHWYNFSRMPFRHSHGRQLSAPTIHRLRAGLMFPFRCRKSRPLDQPARFFGEQSLYRDWPPPDRDTGTRTNRRAPEFQ